MSLEVPLPPKLFRLCSLCSSHTFTPSLGAREDLLSSSCLGFAKLEAGEVILPRHATASGARGSSDRQENCGLPDMEAVRAVESEKAGKKEPVPKGCCALTGSGVTRHHASFSLSVCKSHGL